MIKKEFTIGKETISVDTQNWAKQADGSVVYRCGDTVLLATVCASKEPMPGASFFPLTVEYREKFYSVGKIPGGFIKRETRPQEAEVLLSRLIDRPIRPLFPKGFYYEVQLLVTVLSHDAKSSIEGHAINAASLCLSVSDIPFDGPIGGVMVGRVDGEFVVNPTKEELDRSDLNLLLAGSADAVVMIEGEAEEIPADEFMAAVKYGHKYISEFVGAQNDFVKEVGPVKREVELKVVDEALVKEVMDWGRDKMSEANVVPGKDARQEAINAAKDAIKANFIGEDEDDEDRISAVKAGISDLEYEVVRKLIFDKKVRSDGRKLDEIRDISIELDVLPGAHGSAIFTRGETQSLGVLTLGTGSDAQRQESLAGQSEKQFILHYNFPSFSVGEVRRLGPPGRREIGHGNLAERSLKPVLPKEDFPYTIRLVSEILESNGSSSMASVCSGALAMMAGGVPISGPVSGIAMGLISDGDNYAVLSDIAGLEDHFGDMDFKLSGTEKGITAFQLDLKLKGISFEIMEDAIAQAEKGRMHILDIMKQHLEAPRTELPNNAPRMVTMKIDKEQIGGLIGPGGKVIREITSTTGTEIDIDEDGKVSIFSVDPAGANKAMEIIEGLFAEAEVGKIYEGKVTRITDFGAFVEILPGKEGLVHISKLDNKRVNKVSDIVKEGEIIEVKCVGIDRQGRIDLSRKEVLGSRN